MTIVIQGDSWPHHILKVKEWKPISLSNYASDHTFFPEGGMVRKTPYLEVAMFNDVIMVLIESNP